MQVKDLQAQYAQLKNQRQQWETLWLDIQDILIPYRGILSNTDPTYQKKENGDKRIDGTGTVGLRTLSAGIHGGLTSPAQKWFRLGVTNAELRKLQTVKEWLSLVEDKIYSAFRKSNFYQAIQDIYIEAAGFGTGVLWQAPNKDSQGFWFKVIPTGTYCISSDKTGTTDTMFRSDWLTVKQIAESFGQANMRQSTVRLLKEAPFTKIEIIHAVVRNPDYDEKSLNPRKKKFLSVYFEAKSSTRGAEGKTLRHSGFDTFPYHVIRWEVNGSNQYGFCPGMDSLPDNKSLQAVSEDLLLAIQKEIDPPLNVPAGLEDTLDLMPGGRNPTVGNEVVSPTYQLSPQLQAALHIKQDLILRIENWFYKDLFVLFQSDRMTATEIVERKAERLIQLGPVIQRFFNELLEPIIGRSFEILYNQGALPEAPPELQGQEFTVEFISTLAQAQRLVDVQKIERFFSSLGGIAQLAPQVLDLPDYDESIRAMADAIGVPPTLLKGNLEVQQGRELKAQQEALAAQQEMANQSAQTAATLSNAKTNEDNVLTEMMTE